MVPIAFAFVENENTESWYWFLERVKIHVVAARPEVCLISESHAGLLAAIRQLHEESRGQPPLWPDVVSRWCIRHMSANFYERFKNKELMNLFKRLCTQNQQRKFDALWQVLDNEQLIKLHKLNSYTRISTSSYTSKKMISKLHKLTNH